MPDLADVAVLPAGRELDVLVAEHVKELPRCNLTQAEALASPGGQCSLYGTKHYSADWYDVDGGELPGYSTDDGVAITEIALPLSADGRHWWAFEQHQGGWMAHLREHHGDGRGGWLDVASEFGETLALAICRTALAAKVAG